MHPMNDSSSDLQTLVQSAQAAFDAATSPADLENAKARFLGKSGSVTELLKGMAALSPEDKKTRADAVKHETAQARERERMLASLSIDVLKHLSDKTQQNRDRQQRERQINRPQPPKKGE